MERTIVLVLLGILMGGIGGARRGHHHWTRAESDGRSSSGTEL